MLLSDVGSNPKFPQTQSKTHVVGSGHVSKGLGRPKILRLIHMYTHQLRYLTAAEEQSYIVQVA